MTTLLRGFERVLLVAGTVMVGTAVAVTAYGHLSARLALSSFDRVQSTPVDDRAPATDDAVEFSLWDPRRIQHYKESLLTWQTPPMAVLRIEAVGLRVPVFEGTDDDVLNRGAGWIEGTTKPGDAGNVGIAGHRDGFFRSLKDVAVGDRIEVAANGSTRAYTVDEIVIVDPDDVHVLSPRARPSVTLVTCYPFYFVGSAPQRYIVHASVLEGVQPDRAQVLRPAASRIDSEKEED